jgi:hypothetical protein
MLFLGKGTHAFCNANCLVRDTNFFNLLGNESFKVKKLKIKLGLLGIEYTDSIFLFENQHLTSRTLKIEAAVEHRIPSKSLFSFDVTNPNEKLL